ncbi:hypothetical protein [Klebsiella phage vB_KpnS-VAC113]|uniref:Uncharacterized protein n=1 Tax=Klebsiella phage vB_KpnS-VAC113 TaxID=2866702 RepID=A0AAE8YEZ1_9CAUD|nr:hypothetical protein [Klebsiella phage vB_KpnS-VAC113]
MNNKIWVLTYTIGTNEGRKSRRLTCDTKAQAEMQQRVLGGEVVEYIRQPESFQVNWPEKIDIDEELDKEQQSIAEPESRTVKLPTCVDDLHGIGMVMPADAVIEMLAAAGIKWEAE